MIQFLIHLSSMVSYTWIFQICKNSTYWYPFGRFLGNKFYTDPGRSRSRLQHHFPRGSELVSSDGVKERLEQLQMLLTVMDPRHRPRLDRWIIPWRDERFVSGWYKPWLYRSCFFMPLRIRWLFPLSKWKCSWLTNGGDPNYLLTGMILQMGMAFLESRIGPNGWDWPKGWVFWTDALMEDVGGSCFLF